MKPRRLVPASLSALVLAILFVVATGWDPLCAFYTPGSDMWKILLCDLTDPPPREPGT
jgi:hypothetical protein